MTVFYRGYYGEALLYNEVGEEQGVRAQKKPSHKHETAIILNKL